MIIMKNIKHQRGLNNYSVVAIHVGFHDNQIVEIYTQLLLLLLHTILQGGGCVFCEEL